MSKDALSELITPGVLRAGINLGNILLVTGETADGKPTGVSPDMAATIAEKLGVQLELVSFASPGAVADALGADEIDIGNIAEEPKRAETISFASPYVEIEATYLVAAGTDFQTVEDVDREGVRIAVSERSAYDLYLTANLKHAELVRGEGLPGALEVFKEQKLEVLSGLRPALLDNQKELPGSRVLEGCFSTVEQAVGTRKQNAAMTAFLKEVIAEAKASGAVQASIDKHGVTGKLEVASRA